MYQEYTWYTDGSCLKNPGGPGGWAFTCVEHPEFTRSDCDTNTTNNIMEMTACIECIKFIVSHQLTNHMHSIYTDSVYVKNGINCWIHTWLKNNWKTSNKQDVKNKALWMTLHEQSQHVILEWNWVKGHNNNPYNEKVDELARQAAKSICNEFQCSKDPFLKK